MKRIEVVAISLFLVSISVLLCYLIAIALNFYVSVYFFWLSIILVISSLIFQIAKFELPKHQRLILIEITAIAVILHLVYVIPVYGISGSDAYGDLSSAKGIFIDGYLLKNTEFINQYSYFPVNQIFGVIFTLNTNIDLFIVAKWVPPILTLSLIPLLYFFIQKTFQNYRIAAFSVLLFTFVQNQIYFNAVFIRETFGLILAVLCIYFYFSTKNKNSPHINYIPAFICLIATVFAHHLTAFMLLVFLSLHLILSRLNRKTWKSNTIKWFDNLSFLLISIFVTITYWAYVATQPINKLLDFTENIFFEEWGANTYSASLGLDALPSLRSSILLYGFYFFTIIFTMILLYNLLKSKNNLNIQSFTLFLICCLVTGFFSLYVVSRLVAPDRFLTYGWLFGFAPLVVAIFGFKRRLFKKVGIILLAAFMLFNVYIIEPTTYAPTSDGTPAAPSIEDFTLAKSVNFTNKDIYGPKSALMAIYNVQNLKGKVWLKSDVSPSMYDYIVIDKNQLSYEMNRYLQTSSILKELGEINEGYGYNYTLIYHSGNLAVYESINK